jgi:hypothetical protein
VVSGALSICWRNRSRGSNGSRLQLHHGDDARLGLTSQTPPQLPSLQVLQSSIAMLNLLPESPARA